MNKLTLFAFLTCTMPLLGALSNTTERNNQLAWLNHKAYRKVDDEIIMCKTNREFLMDDIRKADSEPFEAYRAACVLPGNLTIIQYLESHGNYGPLLTTQENLDVALRIAATHDCYEAVAHLLHKKANPNARVDGPNSATTLYWASKYGNPEVVEWLRIFGGDPNAQGYSDDAPILESPLVMAEEKLDNSGDDRDKKIVKLLRKPESYFVNRKNEVPNP